MTTCTLEFPKKFHQQFIICENLLQPVILCFDFSHNYLTGIDWFSSNQLHLHLGPKSIVILDPATFPLHVIQVSTLLLPCILIKTVSQVTIPPRTITIIPKPNGHHSKIEPLVLHESQQQLLVVQVIKIFGEKSPLGLLCTIINTSSDEFVLPQMDTLVT